MSSEYIRHISEKITTPETTIAAKPTTINSLLRPGKIEVLKGCGWWRDELDLGKSNIYTFSQGHDNTVEHLAIIDTPFGGNRMDQLLSTIAPYKEGTNQYGVIADWQALDDPRLAALMKTHRNALGGDAWQHFADNQPLWSETYTRFWHMDLKRIMGAYATKQQITQMLISDMVHHHSFPRIVISPAGMAESKRLSDLSQFFEKWAQDQKGDEDSREGNWPARWSAAEELFFSEEHETQNKLLSDYAQRNHRVIVPELEEDGEVVLKDNQSTVVTYSKTGSTERLAVQIGKQAKLTAKHVRDKDGRYIWQVKPYDVLDANAMFPILHWEVDTATGERRWLLESLDETHEQGGIETSILQFTQYYAQRLQENGLDP